MSERWTLTSHGTVLGHTGVELTGLHGGSRGWHFIPAAGFESVRPTMLELQQATTSMHELMPDEEALATVREEERPLFVQNALLSDPRATRFLELMDAVEALALELRDDAGVVLPTRTLGVTELEMSPKEFRELLRSIEPNAEAGLAVVPPFYMLVAGT